MALKFGTARTAQSAALAMAERLMKLGLHPNQIAMKLEQAGYASHNFVIKRVPVDTGVEGAMCAKLFDLQYLAQVQQMAFEAHNSAFAEFTNSPADVKRLQLLKEASNNYEQMIRDVRIQYNYTTTGGHHGVCC